MENLKDAVIVAYGRSAIARSGKKGFLRLKHPADYGAEVLAGVLEQLPALDKKQIDDVIVGCAKPEAQQGNNFARVIAIRAGLPYDVPGQTINRFCSSGLQSISIGANMIKVGEANIVIAGGVESMTTIPMGFDNAYKNEWILANEPNLYMPMGLTAEQVAEKYHVTRKEMDEFAVESHKKAARAQENGYFEEEIIPVKGNDLDGNEFVFKMDQGVRPKSSVETLATLDTVFKEGGVVTAGQSSQTSDGAGFLVIMSSEKAKELDIKPIARFLGFAVAGVDPSIMGIGPIAAIPKLMEILNFNINDVDVIELNEAFAAQAIPIIRELKLDMKKVNPNGGAIALGHPLGATGAILTCKILSELKRTSGKYGLVSMCIGGGMGAAGLIEML